MKTSHIFSIFILVVMAQILIPTKMIFDQEKVISKGTAYRFKTEPVDPSDPFKGKYITLNFELTSATTTDTSWVTDGPIYILFENDSLGFARIKDVFSDRPNSDDYLKTKVNWYNPYEDTVSFSFPFDEFYMNETKAYDAEIAHANAQRDSLSNTTYALVYLHRGKAVLENVFINDIPIADFVDKE